MGRTTPIPERKIKEARRLFVENPDWGWDELSDAVGIKSSTIRHILKRRWGITVRGRDKRQEFPKESDAQKTGIISESNITTTDLDRLIEQVNSSIQMLQKEKEKSTDLLAKCINYANKICELQNELARRD